MSKNPVMLLPCPFCGGVANECYQRDDLGDWKIECQGCGAVSCPDGMRYDRGLAVEDWNTRIVNSHRVTFSWEPPGVIGETSVWVVCSDGYMYGPCDRWQDVEKIVREEWQHDRNMVG